jgi:hypothetical protein
MINRLNCRLFAKALLKPWINDQRGLDHNARGCEPVERSE